MEAALTPEDRKRLTANKNLEKARLEKKRLQEQARLAMELQMKNAKQIALPPPEENIIFTDDESSSEEDPPVKQPKRKDPKLFTIAPYKSNKRKTPDPVQTKSTKKPKIEQDPDDDPMDTESNESFFSGGTIKLITSGIIGILFTAATAAIQSTIHARTIQGSNIDVKEDNIVFKETPKQTTPNNDRFSFIQ